MEMHIRNKNKLSNKRINKASEVVPPLLRSASQTAGQDREAKAYVEKIKKNLRYAYRIKEPDVYFSDLPAAYDTVTTTPEGRFTFQLPANQTFYIAARIDSVRARHRSYTWVTSITPSRTADDSLHFHAANQWFTSEEGHVVRPRTHQEVIDLIAKVATGQVPDTLGLSDDWGRTVRLAGLRPDSLHALNRVSSTESAAETSPSSPSVE